MPLCLFTSDIFNYSLLRFERKCFFPLIDFNETRTIAWHLCKCMRLPDQRTNWNTITKNIFFWITHVMQKTNLELWRLDWSNSSLKSLEAHNYLNFGLCFLNKSTKTVSVTKREKTSTHSTVCIWIFLRFVKSFEKLRYYYSEETIKRTK